MNYNDNLNDLTRQVIASLVQIEDVPAEWLPHTVYVEELGEDENGYGVPVYNPYKLSQIYPSGDCVLQNVITLESEERHLSEINIEWLITVLNRYEELISEQKKIGHGLRVFLYAVSQFERNATDEEIVKSWRDGEPKNWDDEQGEYIATECYTPDQFASMVNDESFCDQVYWIRFIKV